jgi:hypothetical protein
LIAPCIFSADYLNNIIGLFASLLYLPHAIFLNYISSIYINKKFRERRSSQSSDRQHASRPDATPLDFVVRPQSRIDPEEVRARAKQVVQDQRRLKVGLSIQ